MKKTALLAIAPATAKQTSFKNTKIAAARGLHGIGLAVLAAAC